MGGKRLDIIPAAKLWFARLDQLGQLRLADADGNDPLEHPDPLRQLHNVHLASQAPVLRIALGRAADRLMRLHDGAHRDEDLVSWCWYVAHSCAPPASEVARVEASGGQVQLQFRIAA